MDAACVTKEIDKASAEEQRILSRIHRLEVELAKEKEICAALKLQKALLSTRRLLIHTRHGLPLSQVSTKEKLAEYGQVYQPRLVILKTSVRKPIILKPPKSLLRYKTKGLPPVPPKTTTTTETTTEALTTTEAPNFPEPGDLLSNIKPNS